MDNSPKKPQAIPITAGVQQSSLSPSACPQEVVCDSTSATSPFIVLVVFLAIFLLFVIPTLFYVAALKAKIRQLEDNGGQLEERNKDQGRSTSPTNAKPAKPVRSRKRNPLTDAKRKNLRSSKETLSAPQITTNSSAQEDHIYSILQPDHTDASASSSGDPLSTKPAFVPAHSGNAKGGSYENISQTGNPADGVYNVLSFNQTTPPAPSQENLGPNLSPSWKAGSGQASKRKSVENGINSIAMLPIGVGGPVAEESTYAEPEYDESIHPNRSLTALADDDMYHEAGPVRCNSETAIESETVHFDVYAQPDLESKRKRRERMSAAPKNKNPVYREPTPREGRKKAKKADLSFEREELPDYDEPLPAGNVYQ